MLHKYFQGLINRLEKEWAYLLTTTKDEDKAYGGPSDSPLQLPIPAWMTGTEATIKELDVFETKQLSSESKASNMSAIEPLHTIVRRPWSWSYQVRLCIMLANAVISFWDPKAGVL